MISVVFLVRSLDRGGAERQLTLLVKEMDRSRFGITVVTFYDGGAFRPELEGLADVEVLSLKKVGRWDLLLPMWRLARILRLARPQIVHGYLGIANELALVFGKMAGAKVVWGLRSSDMDFAHYDWLPALSFRGAARLSGFADLIIANSTAGRQHHVANGYSSKNLIVIPNGFDSEKFHPDPAAGQRMRTLWGIAQNQPVIGLPSRLDPIKDHPTFLRAAALLAAERNDVQFVCVGGGSELYRQELQELASALGLGDRLVWAGEVQDMPGAHNAFDIATLTSTSEGFPNSVGEAMACGIPCVATDVGDSAILVGAAGLVVAPGDPVALAAAWRTLLNLPDEERAALGKTARQRIVDEYSVGALTRGTATALARLVQPAD